MPYIAPSGRKYLESALNSLIEKLSEGDTVFGWDAGVLNYLFTRLALAYVKENGESYQSYNDIMGALRIRGV